MIEKLKRYFGIIIVALVVCCITGIVPKTANAASTVRETFYVGDEGTCILSNPSGVKIKWTVSNNKIKVLKKNKYGLKFKAKSAGNTKVVAKSNTQKVIFKLTIKKRNLQTVDLGTEEYEVGIDNVCTIPNATGEAVTWKVSNGNISVLDKNNYALRFLTVKEGTTTVTAITSKYKYKWSISIVDDASISSSSGTPDDGDWGDVLANTDLGDLVSSSSGTVDFLNLTESDLEYCANLIENFVEGLDSYSGVTMGGLNSFVEQVLYFILTSENFPTESEILAFMESVSYCLYL